ncbi:MAG: M23 family metallopeptidase [Gammaproteobacteria bacterium]|nr:M23 family metallopeptidase [Gammaproteobacteria bacterium]
MIDIILFSKVKGRPGSINLSESRPFLLMVSLIALVFTLLFVSGYYLGQRVAEEQPLITVNDWQSLLNAQQQELAQMEHVSQINLDALALRLGQIQAQMVRMNAFGQHLTEIAQLDYGEFNFAEMPAVGGANTAEYLQAISIEDFIVTMRELSLQMDDRQQQLLVLEAMILNQNLVDQGMPSGRPINKGWLSSRFGQRTDPFSGRQAIHKGVDYAGKMGSDIITVAAGVVTWSGQRSGYGNMVEVNHGNGYVTRYAHNQKNLVVIGDTVKKGQCVALMGSSGRSTGPHVHFEVLKNGKTVDPVRYVNSARG